MITFWVYTQQGLTWLWFTLAVIGVAIIWIPLYWCVYVPWDKRQPKKHHHHHHHDTVTVVLEEQQPLTITKTSSSLPTTVSSSSVQKQHYIDKYKQLQQEAKNNPQECLTERDKCRADALRQKFRNDKTRADQIDSLESRLRLDPQNTDLQHQLLDLRRHVADDIKAVSDCDVLPDSNACTERLVAACDDAIKHIAPEALHQYADLKRTGSTETTLSFCKGAVF